MSKSIRLVSLAVAALAAVSVLSACDTRPGAAAVIGSHQITTGELQSQVNASLADSAVSAALANPQTGKVLGGNRTGFIRETLSRLISEQVVDKVAAAHGITVTRQDISSQTATFVQQAGSLTALQQSAASQVGVSPKQLPELIRFSVQQQKLGTALTANLVATPEQLATEYQKDIDTYDQINIAQIAVKSKTEAQSILAKVTADPSSFAALAAKDSLDAQSKANGGNVGFVGRSEVLKVLGPADQNPKPGSFVIAHTSGDYVVIHIIARKLQPLADVTDQLKAALFSQQSQALLQKAITSESAKLGIHVSPRYGRWNGATQAVVAAKSPVSAG